MKKYLVYLVCFFSLFSVFGQSKTRDDAQGNVLIRIDATAAAKADADNTVTVLSPSGIELVSFSSTAEGIYVNVLNGTNKIRLFALTGQLLLNGDLKQGRFFIPTRKGIYFLRINNNSYKVICR